MNSQLKVTEENEVRKDAEDKEEKVLDDDNNEDEVEEDIYQHESIPGRLHFVQFYFILVILILIFLTCFFF